MGLDDLGHGIGAPSGDQALLPNHGSAESSKARGDSGAVRIGIHDGVPFSSYVAIDACSASALIDMKRSAAYCRRGAREQTEAMQLGAATHAAILEPDAFERRFGRVVAGHGSSREVKEHKAALVEAGLYPLAAAAYDKAIRMRDAIWSHRRAADLLRSCEMREATAVWRDPGTGVLCKCRPDALGAFVCVDVKTSAAAHAEKFPQWCDRYSVHVRVAHYLAGLAELGRDMTHRDGYRIIAVENTEPHEVAVYPIHADMVEAGNAERDRLLASYAACVRAGDWPGYGDGEQEPLVLPEWRMKQLLPEYAAAGVVAGPRLELDDLEVEAEEV